MYFIACLKYSCTKGKNRASTTVFTVLFWEVGLWPY